MKISIRLPRVPIDNLKQISIALHQITEEVGDTKSMMNLICLILNMLDGNSPPQEDETEEGRQEALVNILERVKSYLPGSITNSIETNQKNEQIIPVLSDSKIDSMCHR